MELHETKYGSPVYEQILRLRHRVLREPLGLVLDANDVEHEDSQFHLVALEEGQVIGCILLRPIDDDAVQFRQMAIDPNHQGQGVGRRLLKFAEEKARSLALRRVQMEAREVARGFYEKAGYQVLGPRYLKIGIPHYKMVKTL